MTTSSLLYKLKCIWSVYSQTLTVKKLLFLLQDKLYVIILQMTFYTIHSVDGCTAEVSFYGVPYGDLDRTGILI